MMGWMKGTNKYNFIQNIVKKKKVIFILIKYVILLVIKILCQMSYYVYVMLCK